MCSASARPATASHGQSATGSGVSGEASTTGIGVRGTSISGSGIYGWSQNATGIEGHTGNAGAAAISGTSSNGTGVFGMSTSNTGVDGRSTSGNGVYGSSGAADHFGVFGVNSSGGTAVFGSSASGHGVHGITSGGPGAFGVFGEASGDGSGVRGSASTGIGVWGSSVSAWGVYGYSSGSGIGVYGVGTSSQGVKGVSTASYGVWGEGTIGMYAHNSSGTAHDVYLATSALAGDFYGNVNVRPLAGVGNRAVYSDASGVLTNSSSDARLKKDVVPLSERIDLLAALASLRGVEFAWDTSVERAAALGDRREIGMIAQEVEFVLPQVVGAGTDGYLTLDYAKLTAFLIEVAKAQQREIDELKAAMAEMRR